MKLFISKDIEEKCNASFSRMKREKAIDEWTCDIISINRRKVIVFLNEKSSFCFFYYRPEAADYKHLSDIFRSSLKKNLEIFNSDVPDLKSIEVYKGESKREIEKVKERLMEYSSYFTDEDKDLLYPSYLLNSKRMGIDKYTSELKLKRRDISLLFDITKVDEKKKASLLLPPHFTLKNLKDAIEILFSLDSSSRSDFLVFNGDVTQSELKYKRECIRYTEKELDARLKRKECRYALISSTLLGTVEKDIYFRSSLVDPIFFKIELSSKMEGYKLKGPLILSLKWADLEEMNTKLKAIKP